MIRGEIWWADFGIPLGSEPGFRRPVLIAQADVFNKSKMATVVIVPFTTNLMLGEAPGNLFVRKNETGLTKDSVIVASQIYAIDKKRLVEKIDFLKSELFKKVENGIKLVLGI